MSEEFVIPSNKNNIVKYGIIGVIAIVILGTVYCFMTKKLMFKQKKVKKVEKFSTCSGRLQQSSRNNN